MGAGFLKALGLAVKLYLQGPSHSDGVRFSLSLTGVPLARPATLPPRFVVLTAGTCIPDIAVSKFQEQLAISPAASTDPPSSSRGAFLSPFFFLFLPSLSLSLCASQTSAAVLPGDERELEWGQQREKESGCLPGVWGGG